MPKKQVPETVHIDQDLVAWFQAQGEYEKRINAALRIYAEAHKDLVEQQA